MRPVRSSTASLLILAALLLAGAWPAVWANDVRTGSPAQGPMLTRWARTVSPTNVWPEYPRPQLVRPDWLNLNGRWDYAISPAGAPPPKAWRGQILVPFPVESYLSGVTTNLDEHSELWYQRRFLIPSAWQGRRVRLHFGAVDYRCQVWVNHHPVGCHEGGYDAFTMDITEALTWSSNDTITVCVADPTEGNQPRGKQSLKPDGIFYTASSGIWQTVWLEPVAPVCIDELRCVPDLDNKCVQVTAQVGSLADDLQVEISALVEGRVVAKVVGRPGARLTLELPNPHDWSPGDPFLY
ncbi:MAG TPA: glycoside hydrolase family 2, partial [Verrucomicrobiae bacterium]